MNTPLTWSQSEYPIVWSSNSYTWNDVSVTTFVADAIGGGSGGIILTKKSISDVAKKHPTEFENFVKIVCKVNNLDYVTIKQRKVKPIVLMGEIKRTFEEVIKATVTVKNIA